MSTKQVAKSCSVRILKPPELLSQPALLHNLVMLINDAYDKQNWQSDDADPSFESKRLQSGEQIVQELGEEGLVALIFDSSLGEGEGKYGDLVATGSITPWAGTVLEASQSGQLLNGEKPVKKTLGSRSAEASESGTLDWEVAMCASVPDSRYRGTGLVATCVEALRKELISKIADDSLSAGSISKQIPIKFWVSVLVGVGNVEYWQRRGYEFERPIENIPAGPWSARNEFKIATMSKIVA